MMWDNKTRKMFIIIVSLLFILQAIAVSSQAEAETRTSNDSSDSTTASQIYLDRLIKLLETIKTTSITTGATEASYEDEITTSTTSDSDTSTGDTDIASNSNSNDGSTTTDTDTSYNTDSNTQSLEASSTQTETIQDTKNQYLDTIISTSSQSEEDLDIGYEVAEEDVLKLTVTLDGNPVEDATVTILGSGYQSGDDGSVYVELEQIPTEIDRLLVTASDAEGNTECTKYVSITENDEDTQITSSQEFLHLLGKQNFLQFLRYTLYD